MTASVRKHWLLTAFLVTAAAGAITLVVGAVAEMHRSLVLKQTHNDLHWIGMALHRYHDERGSFPPVIGRDENGKSIHSWRSLIQPHLAAIVDTDDDFYAYNFAEPWDSQHNVRTDVLHRFGDHPYQFLAVIGPHAAWTNSGTRMIGDFNDGTSNTIMVIAIRDTGIRWHEPEDATVNGRFLTVANRQLDLSRDIFVLTADGAVQYFADGLPPDVLPVLITVDGGESISEW